MKEENQISYYSVIPATVRYDNKLKASEKLLYGEITSLTNKEGYCFATNRYFSNLYNVNPHTVSQWISHLQKEGYIYIELIRDKKKEIKERRIYIRDNPYVQKNIYPYILKSTYTMSEKEQDNNKNNKIDDLFISVVNNDSKISNKFLAIIKSLGFDYTEEMLQHMKEDKIKMVKDIIFVIYELYYSQFNYIIPKLKRNILIDMYIVAKEYYPINITNYYKRSIINKYTNNST